MNVRPVLLFWMLLALLAGGCAGTRPDSPISKVQMHHMRSERLPGGVDQLIVSEQRKRLHGAITPRERRERLGNYYSVHWRVAEEGGPVTVLFEYRQAERGSEVRRQEVVVPSPRGKQITHFQVTGPAYATDGRVIAWRITLLRDGQPIAVETSYLWD